MNPRPFRIVRVQPQFAPAWSFGGVVTTAEAVVRELARRGHRCRVVTTDNGVEPGVPRDRWVERDGYEVYYARTGALHRRVPYWSPMLRAPLREAFARADLADLHVGLSLATVLAADLARRAGLPYVYNAEGALCPRRLRIKGLRKALFLRLFERRTLRGAAAVQALTEKDRRDAIAQGAPPERVHVIPNGVPLPAPPSAPRAPGPLRRRLGIPGDAVLVLFLGRLARIKGVDLLLEAFARARRPSDRLVFVGPAEEGVRADLEDRIRKAGLGSRVHLEDPVPPSARDAVLRDADIFALCSRTEGLPMAVLEACAAGLPCLVTPSCNLPEIAEAGAGACAPEDPAALAEALRPLLDDPALRARSSEAARSLIEERFSLPAVVDRLEELYASVRNPGSGATRG